MIRKLWRKLRNIEDVERCTRLLFDREALLGEKRALNERLRKLEYDLKAEKYSHEWDLNNAVCGVTLYDGETVDEVELSAVVSLNEEEGETIEETRRGLVLSDKAKAKLFADLFNRMIENQSFQNNVHVQWIRRECSYDGRGKPILCASTTLLMLKKVLPYGVQIDRKILYKKENDCCQSDG